MTNDSAPLVLIHTVALARWHTGTVEIPNPFYGLLSAALPKTDETVPGSTAAVIPG